MRLLWKHKSQGEEFRFVLTDDINEFNEDNLTLMIWTIRFEFLTSVLVQKDLVGNLNDLF